MSRPILLSRSFLLAIAGLSLLLFRCGNEYRCPDPIGMIVRDDCDVYKTKYEALKVELSFSIGVLTFGASAGKEKLRDPSELLQVLMMENMALCKDYNACRVPSTDYRRRREEADRKFTAAVAIGQQLKLEGLDKESKRMLVRDLIAVIIGRSIDRKRGARTPRGSFWRRPLAFQSRMFRSRTTPWFGSRFMPARPELASGLPVLAAWWIGHGSGISKSTHINFTFWGKTEADDRVFVSFSDSQKQYDAAVKPHRKKPQGKVRISERGHVGGGGTMTLDYKLGATGKKHRVGTFRLDPEIWLGRGYLAYHPDPIHTDPVEYERPWIIIYSKVRDPRASMRCELRGKKIDNVIIGESRHRTYSASRLTIHALPLPVRIAVKGGRARTTWRKSMPGEKPLVDMLASEGAGKWSCKAKINARVARVLSFELRADGSVVPQRKPDDGAWPWWPIKTERVPNSVERAAESAR